MTQKLEIEDLLIGLNEYTNANRRNRYAGNKLKRQEQDLITTYIYKSKLKPVKKQVDIHYLWKEKHKRRDKDNIASAKKFIQDALVEVGILENDGWKNIRNFTDTFVVDKEHAGVTVTIKEV